MHSLRPCLTVFVIVFALCIGATQSESAGQDIQVTCADPTQKFSFTFIFNTTGKNENLELSGTQMGSKFSEKIENFIYQKDTNSMMFKLKGHKVIYIIKLDKGQWLKNFKLKEPVVCIHKKIVKKKIAKKTSVSADLRAITTDGRNVILMKDGRWKFTDDGFYKQHILIGVHHSITNNNRWEDKNKFDKFVGYDYWFGCTHYIRVTNNTKEKFLLNKVHVSLSSMDVPSSEKGQDYDSAIFSNFILKPGHTAKGLNIGHVYFYNSIATKKLMSDKEKKKYLNKYSCEKQKGKITVEGVFLEFDEGSKLAKIDIHKLIKKVYPLKAR